MSEVKEFCAKYSACHEGVAWASKYETLAEVFDNCERSDWMMWMLLREDRLDHPTSVKLAIAFAERVLPIFDAKYPDDNRPRQAIEAAKAWLENPCEKTKNAAYAAYAAVYAAYVAYVAYAAAYVAYAAYAAAYVAYAAYAAAYAARAAADAAADAADAARVAERKAQADIIRNIVGNPWKEIKGGSNV